MVVLTTLVKLLLNNKLQIRFLMNFKTNWQNDLQRNSAETGVDGNKLETYRLFQQNYGTEQYISCLRPKLYRSAHAKFRSGVAPLRLEPGRYERLLVEERICFNCSECVESEEHVLLSCSLYNDLRKRLFSVIRGSYRILITK